ncbi:hypothetical protein AMECASPLE_024195, partial [Ameca splendens]
LKKSKSKTNPINDSGLLPLFTGHYHFSAIQLQEQVLTEGKGGQVPSLHRNQGARPPRCQYRGTSRTRRIAIDCQQGYPVHLDRDIVVIDD